MSIHRQLAFSAVLAATYFVAATLGFRVAFAAEQVTTVWAPTGIALGALLLWGRSLWPGVWIGAFAANVTTDAPLWTAVLIASGNTLEAVAAAWLLTRFADFDPAFRRARDGVLFILIAAVLSTAVSATVGVATLCWAGVQPWARFAELWWTWWLGDALGALVVAPVILTLGRSPTLPLGTARKNARRRWAETAALVAGAAIVTVIVFGQFLQGLSAHPLEYVLFPFVIAAAVRLRQPATALVVLVASAVTIWSTLHGTGPFAGRDVYQGLVLLQVFLAVVASTGIVLGAAILERVTGEQRRGAARAVGDVLIQATSVSSAASAILQVVSEKLEWATGAVWMVNPRTQRLQCVSVHARSIPWDSPFVTATREMEFAPGVGLPGRVWTSGEATWVENVVGDPNFPRKQVARAAGLHGAFAFPIRVGADVRGVVEFFNQSARSPDADLLETMSTVGNQIGQFVARKEVEVAIADAELERERLLERELIARREAEGANRAKDEFLATLSHELRTPLNAIIGWVSMLKEGAVDEQAHARALDVIDRNSKLLAQLVADILDVSRIISGGLKLEMRPVDLGAVINSALDVVRPAAAAKRIHLVSRVEAGCHRTEADPQRLQQIVWNLVANSVKFTPEGGRVEVDLLDGGREGLRISVKDDGPGIEPEFLPHVFDRFRQADGSISREHGGLGLGLAIVRHLVELHGGRVRAESAGRGTGSTFVVDLPRVEASPNSAGVGT